MSVSGVCFASSRLRVRHSAAEFCFFVGCSGAVGRGCPLTPDPSPPFRGRGEDWAGFGLLSDTFSELEEVEDDEWVGAADIAVGGARKPVRDDSATGQFRDVDDAEGWLDAS